MLVLRADTVGSAVGPPGLHSDCAARGQPESLRARPASSSAQAASGPVEKALAFCLYSVGPRVLFTPRLPLLVPL